MLVEMSGQVSVQVSVEMKAKVMVELKVDMKGELLAVLFGQREAPPGGPPRRGVHGRSQDSLSRQPETGV